MNLPFERWPLHDGILDEIRIDWSARTLTMLVRLFLSRDRDAQRCILRCSELRAVNVPRRSPWGESTFINGQRRAPDGGYLIEMQSGDVINIDAGVVELVPDDA